MSFTRHACSNYLQLRNEKKRERYISRVFHVNDACTGSQVWKPIYDQFLSFFLYAAIVC